MVRKIFLVLLLALILVSNVCAEEMSLMLVKQKVNQAVSLLSSEGRAGFAKLKDPKGEFRFGDGQGYIWIHNMDGLMVMHPTKPELEGTPTIGLKDSQGFLFIQAMNEIVSSKGEGWVAYLWAKPGTRTESPKVSFVKKIMLDGRPYVVGCGMYDASWEEVGKKFPGDVLETVATFNKNKESK